MVIRLVKRRIGAGHFVKPECDRGTLGLTADQMLTGPNFGLDTTRDELTEQLMLELHELRLRQRRGVISKPDRDRLEQLSFEFDRIAAPVGSFADVQAWREQSAQIRAYNEKVRERRKK